MILTFLLTKLFLYNEVYLGIFDFEFNEIEKKLFQANILTFFYLKRCLKHQTKKIIFKDKDKATHF